MITYLASENHWIWIEKLIMSAKNHVLKIAYQYSLQDEWVGGL